MATYAAFKHVELYNVGKTKKRVLRPPGGGNSQLFGDDMPQTPRSVKNHMASNIFGSEQSASVKQNGDSIRRGQKQIDSYTRLFGEPERNYTPAKNHMKSSIPIGGTSTSSSSSSNGTETNGHKNGNGVHHHQNGNGTITSSSASASSSARNGKMENGGGSSSCTSSEYQNGVSKTVNHNYRKMSNTSARTHLPSNRTTAHSKIIENDENNRQKTTSSSPRNIMGDNDSIMQSSRQPNGDILQNGDDVDKLSNIKEDDDTLSIIGNNNNNCKLNMEEQKQEKNQVTQLRSQKSNYTESSLNSVRNMDIDSSNNSKSATTTATTTPSSAATTSSYYGLINFANANVKSPRRDFNTSRNPVTGTGFGDGLNIRIRRGANIRRDGNPVTGEGYKGAEINTSIPSLNGANQVINKNRIPPGGYSSGLW